MRGSAKEDRGKQTVLIIEMPSFTVRTDKANHEFANLVKAAQRQEIDLVKIQGKGVTDLLWGARMIPPRQGAKVHLFRRPTQLQYPKTPQTTQKQCRAIRDGRQLHIGFPLSTRQAHRHSDPVERRADNQLTGQNFGLHVYCDRSLRSTQVAFAGPTVNRPWRSQIGLKA